jgi:hypothetical protein
MGKNLAAAGGAVERVKVLEKWVPPAESGLCKICRSKSEILGPGCRWWWKYLEILGWKLILKSSKIYEENIILWHMSQQFTIHMLTFFEWM